MLHELFAFLPVVDQHVHNVIESPGQIPLNHILAETADATILADHVPHTMCYRRTLHDLAALFTCNAEDVETIRQSIPVDQLAALSYSNVHALLIDDGYEPHGLKNYPVEWHNQYVPVVKRIYRIEVEVAKFMDDVANPVYDSIYGVRAAFEAAVRAGNGSIVGLKSIACYRTGLGIQPKYDLAAVSDVYATVRSEIKAQRGVSGPFRLMEKTLIDYFIIVALELALELDIPLQFHTGFGDTDMQLEWGNPTLLKHLLDLPQFQRAKIVLLHSSYPYSREAGYLSSVYPQVYVDMGLAVPRLSVEGMKQAVGQLLELCPISKLLFSSDGTITPEMTYIGVKWGKFVLAELLQQSITANELTVDQALAAAKKIFFENAVALYHLPTPEYSIVMPADAPSVVAVPSGVKMVRLVWCGNDGLMRAKCVQSNRPFTRVQCDGVALTSAVQGLMSYADVLAPDCGLTSSEEIWLMPDVATLVQLPHHPKHAMTLVHLKDRDGGTTLCPRSAAHRQVDRLRELGLEVYCGFENEFNLYNAQNEPVDTTSYCQTYAINQSAAFLDELVEAIADIGAPLWLVHPEACVGQFEVTLTKLHAMEAADKQLFLREIIKGVAVQHGYQACFLPKPFEMQAGNGAHLHLSLWRGHENLTTDLPPLVKHFMAGILAHLDGILAVSCATVNSYARLAPGCWAGTYKCWGIDNKEAAIRLCTSHEGYSNFELKTVDGTATPHLVLAVVLAAGLDGIQRELELAEPVHGDPHALSDAKKALCNVTRLTTTLDEALDAFEADQVLVDALGARQAKAYVAVKRAHALQFQKTPLPEFVQTFRTKF